MGSANVGEKPELVKETVAKAIYEARNGKGCKPWSRQPASHQDPYLTDAAAAIDAYHDYIRRHS
jgi:acyl-CoA reductase-like NAD-dependent aldehyde dehydrogenase